LGLARTGQLGTVAGILWKMMVKMSIDRKNRRAKK
jgi:hypothetical protein